MDENIANIVVNDMIKEIANNIADISANTLDNEIANNIIIEIARILANIRRSGLRPRSRQNESQEARFHDFRHCLRKSTKRIPGGSI